MAGNLTLNSQPTRCLHFFAFVFLFDADSRADGAPQKIDHAVIGGIVAVVVFAMLCLLIVLARYFARHKGKSKGTILASAWFWVVFLSVEMTNVPVLRYLLYPRSQRSGRRRGRRHCHHQRRGGTQQFGWQEGVLHLTLTRPASFLCWTANCGLLGWEVGVVGFNQAGFTPVQLKRRWGEGAAIETDGVWDGRALGELNFRPLHHPTPPAGPVLFSLNIC